VYTVKKNYLKFNEKTRNSNKVWRSRHISLIPEISGCCGTFSMSVIKLGVY